MSPCRMVLWVSVAALPKLAPHGQQHPEEPCIGMGRVAREDRGRARGTEEDVVEEEEGRLAWLHERDTLEQGWRSPVQQGAQE